MADYDYGNARVRALKSRLLSPADLRRLSHSDDLGQLIGALTETPYRAAVEATLVRLSGTAALNEAWRRDLVQTLRQMRRFYAGEAGELVALALDHDEVNNVRTILRGLAQQSPADEILALLAPVGELPTAELEALAKAGSPREAIDLLATWRSPLAAPLLALRATAPGADVPEMELALLHWYWDRVLATQPQNRVWQETMRLEVDVSNLLTALRFVGRLSPGSETRPYFLGPGEVSLTRLEAMARQPVVPQAIAELATTPYEPALAAAQAAFERNGRLRHFERALDRMRLQHAQSLFVRDPLGVGVPLGYMRLKRNEITNLRLIAQGIYLQEPASAIVERLLFARQDADAPVPKEPA